MPRLLLQLIVKPVCKELAQGITLNTNNLSEARCSISTIEEPTIFVTSLKWSQFDERRRKPLHSCMSQSHTTISGFDSRQTISYWIYGTKLLEVRWMER